MEKNIFNELNSIDVSAHTEKRKNGNTELTYLSWSWAIAEIKKRYPTMQYEIKRFGDTQLPYVYDENTGYMVFTSVTIEDITHEMWLPVMDGNNKAMKKDAYEYTTKFGTKTVASATMFDINKAIMRCLVKNLAMFGLGLYIYNGEDLPEKTIEYITEEQINQIKALDINLDDLCAYYKIGNIKELTSDMANKIIKLKMKKINKMV